MLLTFYLAVKVPFDDIHDQLRIDDFDVAEGEGTDRVLLESRFIKYRLSENCWGQTTLF